MDTSPRKVAIVAALEREVRPLVRGWRSYRLPAADGLHRLRFFESPGAVVVCGGIGREAATEATRAVIERYRPQVVVSAGFAGALVPELRVASLLNPDKVIAASTGTAFETGGVGSGVLVTAAAVAGAEEKRRLAERFSAQAVDMEAAAVARAAQAEGVSFRALKAISDELDFPVPPSEGFIDARGEFKTLRFALFVALRPRLWGPARTFGRNCSLAADALARALTSFVREAEQGSAPASPGTAAEPAPAAGVPAKV
jgi:adenosylhomocysteine nucleosidase